MIQQPWNTAMMIIILAPTVINGINLQCTNRNGQETFRILQFTDTHYGSNKTSNSISQTQMSNLISYEDPDLVSLSGDIVSGYDWDGHTSGFFKDTFDQAIEPVEQAKKYWAYTLGNHDDEGDWNRTQIVDYAKSLNYSLTEKGPNNIGGVTNYVHTVYSSNSSGSIPIANIWFMDSLDNNCYNISGYNCVEFSTVEWYKETSISLEEQFGRKLPGIVYIHIPLPELLLLWNDKNFETSGFLEDSGVCCWSLNTGLFSVMIERGDIISVWHGHDHDNDFMGNYHGIVIGYGRKTAMGGYGPPINIQRGGRVIEFNCNNNINNNIKKFEWATWIREDDGKKVTNQTVHHGGDWLVWKECCASDGFLYGNRNLDPKRINHQIPHKEL